MTLLELQNKLGEQIELLTDKSTPHVIDEQEVSPMNNDPALTRHKSGG